MFMRTLGRSGLEVTGIGLGCWAIGGPTWRDGKPVGWSKVDDNESLRALQRGLELGLNFFDTADVYGCGHSERLLGQVLASRRDKVVIATKFGYVCDESSRTMTHHDASPDYIRRACEASLRRLQTDYIDLYQFHVSKYDLAQAEEVVDTLEQLVAAGKIRAYGWSTDDPARAQVFARGSHCAAIQQRLNVFEGSAEILALCESAGLASINRGPLAMGLLTGKFSAGSALPQDDVRHDWDFRQGEAATRLQQLAALREVLTSDGRTLAQGALGWLWARSEHTVPIPGFKTVGQVEENAGALRFGPLSAGQMQQIELILDRGR